MKDRRDPKRLAQVIRNFVAGCSRPLYLMCVDSAGVTSVTRYGVDDDDIKLVCSGPPGSHRYKLVPPLRIVTLEAGGKGRSATITVEGAQPATMQ